MKKHITPEDIQANIACEYTTTLDKAFEGSPVHDRMRLVTLHVIVLRNGCVVTGEAGCIDPARFDADIGYDVARRNAINKIWPLMGYALLTEIHNGENDDQVPQVSSEERLRAAGKPEVSDAGQEPRGERESAGEPAGEEGQPVEVSGSEDRREGEQGVETRQVTDLKYPWRTWLGRTPRTLRDVAAKLQLYFKELGVVYSQAWSVLLDAGLSEAEVAVPMSPDYSDFITSLYLAGHPNHRPYWGIADLLEAAEKQETALKQHIDRIYAAVTRHTHKPYSAVYPYPPLSGNL